MIPVQGTTILNVDVFTQPTLTYKWDVANKRIINTVDGEEAILQFVNKVLNTERYAYVIFSGNYGTDLEKFIGADYNYIKSDMERTVSEALLADDRIISITDFETVLGTEDTMAISFTINSIVGQINIQSEVVV
jgi:hypothetical protein